MLTDTMFWRLVWKEYRVQRSLWLAVVVLTPLVQLCPLLYAGFSAQAPPAGLFVGIALAATAVYMLGCGATLFATERELGTFEFQRSLPVDAWRVFSAKTGLALASGCALSAVLWSVTFALFIRPWLLNLEQYLLIGLVATAEVFAWGVCFSLLLRRPLWAAFLGVLVPSAIIGNLLPGATAITWTWGLFEYQRHYLASRAVLAGVVFVADAWLAWLWFNGRLEGLRRPRWWPRRARESYPDVTADQPLPAFQGGRRADWSRLFWLVWRQAGWIGAALVACYLVALFLSLREDPSHRMRHPPFLLFPTLLVSIVFGLCAFALDQVRDQFRWFAEQGIAARRVWLSRQLVWLPLVTLLGAGISLFGNNPSQSPRPDFEWAGLMSVCFLIPLTWYALGQFCAMFSRSTLVAAVTAWALAVLATTWNVLMVVGDVPLAWSVAPIPLALLLATWLYAPDWVEERWNRRVALRLVLVLGAPALLLAIAVPVRRAYQIPLVEPGFSVTEFTRSPSAVEEETLDLYMKAWQAQCDGDQRTTEWMPRELSPDERPTAEARRAWRQQRLDAQQAALTLLKQAHERGAVPLTLVKEKLASEHISGSRPPLLVMGFVHLFLLQAEELQESDDLDGAWQHYDMALEMLRRLRLRASAQDIREADWNEAAVLDQLAGWAAHPQQTRHRIEVALTGLEQSERRGLAGDSAAKRYHVALLSALRGDVSGLDDNNPWLPGLRQWALLNWWLPSWERCRMERLFNHATHASLTTQARQAAKVASAVAMPRQEEFDLSPDLRRWSESTWFPPLGNYIFAGYMEDSLLERTINYRGTRILVALADWRREHGELPDSLDVLIGPYFPRLPVDPVTGEAFLYFPHGISEEFIPGRLGAFYLTPFGPAVSLAKGRAFLWSPGATRQVTARRTAAGEWEFNDYLGYVHSGSEGVALGRLMPVPLPAKE